jgi:hypothetical protein
LTGAAVDSASGLATVTYDVVDEYAGSYAIPSRSLTGGSASWVDAVALEASRDGGDRDGREFRVTATVTDVAGRSAQATVTVIVPHDQSKKN